MKVQVDDLVVRYGRLQALHGVSLTVDDGDFVAVLGRNGAGKSTLVQTIAGLLRPHSGTITHGGVRISGRTPATIVRQGIAVVPEGRQLFGALSVLDNLRLGSYGAVASGAFGALKALLPRSPEVDRRLDRVLDLLPELRGIVERRSGALSGGQQQMVAIGRALMADPTVLLVDELSLGLAPLVVERLLEDLVTLNATGISIVLIEQNISLALAASRSAYVLDGGLVRYAGRSEELAGDPSVLAAYLGVATADHR